MVVLDRSLFFFVALLLLLLSAAIALVVVVVVVVVVGDAVDDGRGDGASDFDAFNVVVGVAVVDDAELLPTFASSR